MILSVVIVSYNVKYFLEQCLCSVQRAVGYDMEVLVIDNNSRDGTVEYLQHRFPIARFIINTENVGFAKANNQVLKEAKGKYILFLNPDTIVPGNFFKECIGFMESHGNAGAMGVRMIDGGGEFLKESKRGFPTPWVAFCKMSRLTKLFPRSATFARYYMGHLAEHETNTVDALAGACMIVRKDILNQIGGFDEQFFMYAEDIDLSYRVQKAGYKNYYYPHTAIIHFKGESTRKDKRYIHLFYKAMVQFSRKHFGRNVLLEAAINLRAGLAAWGGDKSVEARSESGQAQLYNESKSAQAGSKSDQAASFNKKRQADYSNENNPANTLMNNPGNYRFLNTGDEKSFAELPAANKVKPSNEPPTEALIFCEGPAFSYRQIIDELQKTKGSPKTFFHGYGTNSAVSSTDKNGQGETLSW